MFTVSDSVHMLCKSLDLTDGQEYSIEITNVGDVRGSFVLSREELLLTKNKSSQITREVIDDFIEERIGIYNSLQIVTSIYKMGHQLIIGCETLHIEVPSTFIWVKHKPYHLNTTNIDTLEKNLALLFENKEMKYAFVELNKDGNCILECETFEIGVPEELKKLVNGQGRVFQFPYIIIMDDRVRVNLMHKYVSFDEEKAK